MSINMKVLIFLICAGLSLAARRNYEKYNLEFAENYFDEFIKTYNKQYADEAEKQLRLDIFKKNLENINQRNLESDSAVYGITLFSDLTIEEFLNTYTGLHGAGLEDSTCDRQFFYFTGSAPDAFDWREQNKVSSVKNQGHCGSCWAFSAVGGLESQYAIKYNEILDLSEQQLVDCDRTSFGCHGGWLPNPYMYFVQNGAMSEQDYAYTATEGSCRFDASKVQVKVDGCIVFSPQNEDQLKEILHKIGPLTVGVDATSLTNYHNGVIENCLSNKVNHAVLLVGYGTENGVPFWAIKNSWGENWGDSGYVKVKRGVNACKIMGANPVTARLA